MKRRLYFVSGVIVDGETIKSWWQHTLDVEVEDAEIVTHDKWGEIIKDIEDMIYDTSEFPNWYQVMITNISLLGEIEV